MPRGTVQSVKFHAVAEEGQLGQGGASSGPPGRSRPFSKLARAPDGCGGAGFESQSPFDWISGSPAGLLLSWSVIHGLFWAYFTCAGIAGQSTTAMLYYEPPYSPSHAPLFLAEARGSGWGVGLPSLVGASGGVSHTQGVVGSLWGFAANVTGTMSVLGATGISGAAGVWVPLLSRVLLVSQVPLLSWVLLVSRVLLLSWCHSCHGCHWYLRCRCCCRCHWCLGCRSCLGAALVLGAAGVSGVTGATDVMGATGVSGAALVVGAALAMGVMSAAGVSGAAGGSGVTGTAGVTGGALVAGITGIWDAAVSRVPLMSWVLLLRGCHGCCWCLGCHGCHWCHRCRSCHGYHWCLGFC